MNMVILTCCTCGKMFSRLTGEVHRSRKRHRKHFCAQSCASKYLYFIKGHSKKLRKAASAYSKLQVKDKNPNWKGGVSKLESVQKARKRYPEKYKARGEATYAIKCGRLKRAKFCQDCEQPGSPLEAHHEDYSKPLDVSWVCGPCHDKRHAIMRKEGRL